MIEHPVQIVDGKPTDMAVMLFTESDCWVLAYELSLLLDLPVVTVDRVDSPGDWYHVMVRLCPGILLDIYGPQTEDETLSRWETKTRGRLSIREVGTFPNFYEYCRAIQTDFDVHHDDRFTAVRIAFQLANQHKLTGRTYT